MSTRTPQRSKKQSGDLGSPFSPQFSPLSVSPGRSPIQGNLTGIPRKVKDSCADWHNLTDKWEALNTKGSSIINEIANIKLQALFDAADTEDKDSSDLPSSDMPLEMEPLLVKMQDVHANMRKIVEKLETITTSLQGVSELEQSTNESLSQEPLFQTWTTDTFGEKSKEVLAMYRKELQLKEYLLTNIAHVKDRDIMMFHTASWLHQPYLDDSAKLIIESMLQETGHR